MFLKQLKARIACILAGCALATGAAETCADGVCPLPAAGDAREVAVYSPVPASAVTPPDEILAAIGTAG